MIRNHLTYEQVLNSYEFKVVSKLLKKEYPWIKKVDVDEKALSEYNLIFLDIQINYELFSEMYDVELRQYPKKTVESGGMYDSPFLSLIFSFESRDLPNELQNDITNLANSVRKSPAFPHDLKLPNERTFAISIFYIE